MSTRLSRLTKAGRPLAVGVASSVIALQPFAGAGAQTAIACVAPSGIAPSAITVTNTSPNVTVQWTAVSGARGYAVARRNPDGTCWNLTTTLTTATSLQEAIPAVAGSYAYQVGVLTISGSGASQWMPFTVAAPDVASRTFTLAGFTGSGTATPVASRTFALAGFTASGDAIAVASRSFTLVGFMATGTAVEVASRTFTLPGFTATGEAATVASRTITLAGFTAAGASASVASRTITLAGWTAAGRKKP